MAATREKKTEFPDKEAQEEAFDKASAALEIEGQTKELGQIGRIAWGQ